MATAQNMLTGETRTVTTIDELIYYLQHKDDWQVLAVADPGSD